MDEHNRSLRRLLITVVVVLVFMWAVTCRAGEDCKCKSCPATQQPKTKDVINYGPPAPGRDYIVVAPDSRAQSLPLLERMVPSERENLYRLLEILNQPDYVEVRR